MSRAIKRLFRRIELGLERPQKEIDLAALTDDELMERLREFVAKMVNSWRVSGTQEDALLLLHGLDICPDLVNLLSLQEKLDLGLELAPRGGQLWTRDSSCGCVPPFVVEGRHLTE